MRLTGVSATALGQLCEEAGLGGHQRGRVGRGPVGAAVVVGRRHRQTGRALELRVQQLLLRHRLHELRAHLLQLTGAHLSALQTRNQTMLQSRNHNSTTNSENVFKSKISQ